MVKWQPEISRQVILKFIFWKFLKVSPINGWDRRRLSTASWSPRRTPRYSGGGCPSLTSGWTFTSGSHTLRSWRRYNTRSNRLKLRLSSRRKIWIFTRWGRPWWSVDVLSWRWSTSTSPRSLSGWRTSTTTPTGTEPGLTLQVRGELRGIRLESL